VKKQLFFLFAFTSMAILLAVLAVVRGYASVEAASLTTMAAFASVAGLLLWWNSKRRLDARTKESDKTSSALIWLLVFFSASAVVAVIQAMREKWDIGDTIGLGFFLLFAALSIYEILRRRRRKYSK
jgi:CDP-diglyceride synthetase